MLTTIETTTDLQKLIEKAIAELANHKQCAEHEENLDNCECPECCPELYPENIYDLI